MVNIFKSGGAFVIEHLTSGILYSGDNKISFFKDASQRLSIVAEGLGGSGNAREIGFFLLSEINTIGGNPTANTLDAAIIQLNALLPSSGGGGGTFDGQLTQGGADVSTLNPLPVSIPTGSPIPVTGALTDAQLRATPVSVSGTVLDNINTDLGSPSDVAASSDTGTFSIIAFIKRAMQYWSTLLGRIPTPISGRIPVDVNGVVSVSNFPSTQPVSATALPLPNGAATESTLAALNTKTPAVGQTNMTGSSPVVIASDQSTIPVNQAGVSATGSLAALNATVPLTLNGATGFAVDVRGTFVATILIQGTIDGTNWITLSVLPVGAGLNVAQVGSVAAQGAWWGNGNGLLQVRATASAYTSGTATVVVRAMQATGMVYNMPAGQTTQPVSGTVGVSTLPALPTGINNIGQVAFQFNGLLADVASAAITTNTTTAAFTPTWGVSYQINIPVTVVTGTSPTMDVSIEESDDNGTNWFKVYDFPRITTTGIYRSPFIPNLGNRVRYVQTIGGTTPSFTRAINRNQSNYNALPQRQLIDRTISLTTLNSTTPILLARDCGNATQLIISVGAITTTAPAIQLEGSDDFGLTWYSIGTPLTAVASSTVQVTITDVNAAALRARVSTAGVGVTAGYVMIKAHD